MWTVVDGDPVAMRRGDLLLTPGWAFHGHQNVSDTPMAWLDGLDIPLIAETDQGFFEFRPDQVRTRAPAWRCDSSAHAPRVFRRRIADKDPWADGNRGSRFSLSAAAPSRTSGPMKQSIS